MQSFLKSAFVPSTDTACIVSCLLAVVLAAWVGWTATDMIASVPHDATPTVGDLHVLIIGYILFAVSLGLMASTIGRVIGIAFRK